MSSQERPDPGTRARTALAALLVAALVVALALPQVLARRQLTPDAVGYVSTAHAWLSGRGWVDPVLYSFYLDDARPPVPATVIRPPLFSVLLLAPLALGAGVVELGVLHVLWSALVGVGLLLLLRRLAGLPAALAGTLVVVGSGAWQRLAPMLLTEVTAVGAVLLVLAWAPRGLRRPRDALLLALLVELAVLTRPNLLVLAPALLLAALLELGPRRALRSVPAWVFLAGFVALHAGVTRGIGALTGRPLYEHYGHMFETLALEDIGRFDHEYVGAGRFLADNGPAVLASLSANLRSTARALLLDDHYLYVAWPGLVALAWALRRPGRHGLLLRSAAFTALGVLASGVLSLGGFDPSRYPLPAVVCLALLATVGLARLAQRWGAPRALPFAAALGLLVAGGLPGAVARAGFTWDAYLTQGTRTRITRWDHVMAHVADALDPDQLVAAGDPWAVHFWTGAACVRLPTDLRDAELLHRFLDAYEPGWLLTDGEPAVELLATSPRLELVRPFGRRGGLYRVRGPAPSAPRWEAPRPLAQIGAPRGAHTP